MKNYILRYIKQPKLLFLDWANQVRIAYSANARKCDFEGKNKIYPGASVAGSFVGRGSYVGPDAHLARCKIGRYCSIGPEVLVLSGTHPVDEKLSTHPCFYSMVKQSGFTYVTQQAYDEYLFCDSTNNYYVEIGSDVWLGARAIIMGGVRIGHGAVIAAGSVVTKDVEDYSIVGGVPAKCIRYRFDSDLREKYMAERWWENDEKWIINNLKRFTESRDV